MAVAVRLNSNIDKRGLLFYAFGVVMVVAIRFDLYRQPLSASVAVEFRVAVVVVACACGCVVDRANSTSCHWKDLVSSFG